MTHRHVDAGGVVLHVAEAGSGPPLLLLHGWPQHWWCWRKVFGALAARNHVPAPDLRGFGWSDAPPGSYAKRQFAADILALLDAEGIDQVRIIGHDWGGYTALLLALEHPERVEGVLALDVAPPWLQSATPAPRHLALPVLAGYRTFLTRELPQLPRSSTLRVPTRLAMGADSALWRVLRPRAEDNLRLSTVSSCGHFIPEEAPEAVIELARESVDA